MTCGEIAGLVPLVSRESDLINSLRPSSASALSQVTEHGVSVSHSLSLSRACILLLFETGYTCVIYHTHFGVKDGVYTFPAQDIILAQDAFIAVVENTMDVVLDIMLLQYLLVGVCCLGFIRRGHLVEIMRRVL